MPPIGLSSEKVCLETEIDPSGWDGISILVFVFTEFTGFTGGTDRNTGVIRL